MNYYLAISFILAALLKQVVSGGATLYYYNRNTGNVEYNSGNNDAGDYYPQPLYIKRYIVAIILSNCTEALECRIWLLLHRHQLGLTTARSMHAGQPQTTVCIFPGNMENKAIYRIVLLYFTIILLMLIISRFKGATSFECQGDSCWYR